MKFSKLLVVAFFIAFLAFTIQCVDQLLHPYCKPAGNGGFAWVSFQAWALYFLAGGTLLGGVRSLLGYVSGIVASVAILELAGKIGTVMPANASFFVVPAAIFVVVVPVILMEKLPMLLLDFVPAIFVGAGVFFGFMGYVMPAGSGFQGYVDAGTTIMIYCALGLLYGWMTVAFRSRVAKET